MDRRHFLTGMLFARALAFPHSALAETGNKPTYLDGDQVLTGLTGVYVSVADMAADAEADGLAASDIQSFITKRLTNSKVKAVNHTEFEASPTALLLTYAINTIKSDSGVYAYFTQLQINEPVSLAFPENSFANAYIWQTGHIGLISASNLTDIKQSSIASDVDTFIDAYHKVNKTASP